MVLFLTLCQWFVAGLGVTAVVLAVRWAVFFSRSDKRIARSMIYMLIEQAVSSVGTLLFALNSLVRTVFGNSVDSWNSIHPVAAMVIRLAMFAAMIHSTLHLARSVKEVIGRDSTS